MTSPSPENPFATPPARMLSNEVARSARALDGFGVDVHVTLAWARDITATLRADHASPAARWDALATAAAVDVTAARIWEPHLDAWTILEEAGTPDLVDIGADDGATWGVFAAEGPGVRVEARQDGMTWRLTGTKPWCSLAADLSHALVTAWIDDDTRALFAVDLRGAEARPHAGPWAARGLSRVISAPVDFVSAIAVPVGAPGWYLQRPGFAWGGVGVAAAWFGGALPIARALGAAAVREGADQLAAVHLGAADSALFAASAALSRAAELVDDDTVSPALVAARTRAVVADAVESVLATADRALGPAPLAVDDAHARRVADLRMYLRQHHGERELARLGRKAVATWV